MLNAQNGIALDPDIIKKQFRGISGMESDLVEITATAKTCGVFFNK